MILIWCVGFSITVLFPHWQFTAVLYPILKRNYGTVCHQGELKSFTILGHQLLVCARCTGIYIGALVTSLLTIFAAGILKQIGIKLFLISLVPMALDVVFSTIGLYHYSKFIAFLTGLLFGSVVFIYILTSFENNFVVNRNKDNDFK